MYPKEKIDLLFEQERDRLHLQMMSAVSHDLKTPLASIIGSIEIYNKMHDVLTPEKRQALISTALQEAYRLDGFISNILDMSRLENGMTRVVFQPCDINNVISDCVIKVSDKVKKNEIEIASPPVPFLVDTDPSLLTRAIICLLDNAVKYAHSDDPRISIGYRVDGPTVTIDVKDNGQGVPAEDRERIFDKYTRLTKKDYKNAGTGLGLTICRVIATLLGGQASVKNEPGIDGRGAWFAISLPVRQP